MNELNDNSSRLGEELELKSDLGPKGGGPATVVLLRVRVDPTVIGVCSLLPPPSKNLVLVI